MEEYDDATNDVVDDDDEQNHDHCIPGDQIDHISVVPLQVEEARRFMGQATCY